MVDLPNQSDQGLDPESVRIGHQIRDLRRAKGVTLQYMADKIARSVGYISQVERGVSALPIPVLQSISEVLGVQITWFFHSENEQPMQELGHVVRANSRRQLKFTGTGIHEELLSPSLSGSLLVLLTTFAPLASSDQQPRERKGEAAAYVQSGQLDVTINEQFFSLGAGDSFAINPDDRHSVRNPSETEDAVVVWVITPPNY
ncbi:MAG: transcriptional regulator with XRE-family HTH domain [Cryomorphaceae bacterium]|jgi:transcriptional regulator with XRE-family HTH domain